MLRWNTDLSGNSYRNLASPSSTYSGSALTLSPQ